MFFLLSKTLGFLALPLVIICLGFLLSAWLKNARWKKRVFWISLCMLLFFSNDFIANEVMRAWEIAPTPFDQVDKSYAYGIMLTGVTNNDLLPDDRVYFARGADRVVHTVDLYKRGIIEKIVISGGTGRIFTAGRKEADDVAKAMMLMGVKPDDMIIENESRNTYESADNVKALVGSGSNQRLMLITSAFHLRRSHACFKKAGVEVDTFSTDFYAHPRYFTIDALIVPKVEAIYIWQKLGKEWAGMIAYWMAGYI